jgi:hypothetical protein
MHSTEAATCPHCGAPIDRDAARARLKRRLGEQTARQIRIAVMAALVVGVMALCCLLPYLPAIPL